MTKIVEHCIRRPDGKLIAASEREVEALRYAAAGLNIGEIATAMGIHRATVSSYIYRWSQRAGAQNKTMLAVWAIATGQVSQQEIWDIWEQHVPSLAVWRS